jgi:uncharacterized membrane protein
VVTSGIIVCMIGYLHMASGLVFGVLTPNARSNLRAEAGGLRPAQ